MRKTCTHCTQPFDLEQADLDLLEKLSPEFGGSVIPLPPPSHCPDCRLQRRLTWRMERTLYFRTCGATGKKIMSIYAPESPFIVYHNDPWNGDGWSGLDYGRDYDFNRPFSEQFRELMLKVPLLALNIQNVQNSEFVNQCGRSKNCYMTIESDENEDCLHGYRVFFAKNCVECTEVVRSQQCYECVDCETCFNVRWSQLCKQCSDSSFLFDCRGCQSCFGCTGLRQKKFCIFNKELTEEQYRKTMASFDACNLEHVEAARKQFETLKLALPHRAFVGEQNENVSGNYVYESKDCSDCYNVRGCRDCRHCDMLRTSKDCMDYYVWGDNCERMYDSECCGYAVQHLLFCCDCWEASHDLTYCYQCVNGCGDCFGCIGLRHQKYCILNKQYTKEEYERLVPKIIEHMRKTPLRSSDGSFAGQEWGEFFPITISPFGYNETAAQAPFPLTEVEAKTKGWAWKENLPSHTGTGVAVAVPSGDPSNIPDSITEQVYGCEATQKPFKIIMQELRFYRDNHLPLPRIHPDERHRRRMLLRNPRKLWDRTCANCAKPIKTSYAPERKEKIVCEECYLKEVY